MPISESRRLCRNSVRHLANAELVEQASVIGWDRYVGMNGAKIGMHTFGSSAPLKDLLTKFGFTLDKVVAAAKDQIVKSQRLNS
jgi:transketolase